MTPVVRRRASDYAKSRIPGWVRVYGPPVSGFLTSTVVAWVARKGIPLSEEAVAGVVGGVGAVVWKGVAAVLNPDDAATPSKATAGAVAADPEAQRIGKVMEEYHATKPAPAPVPVAPTEPVSKYAPPLVPPHEIPAPLDPTKITDEHPLPVKVVADETAAPPAPKKPAAKRPPKKKTEHTVPPPADIPEGEEHGAEQIDPADLPPSHEDADYRPLGARAMPDPGKGDERVGEYFVLGEFAVSASHPNLVVPVPAALVPKVRKLASTCLDPIRRFCGKPVTVLSGDRDARLNAAVGGSPTSQHRHGEAADITTKAGVRPVFEAMLANALKVPVGQTILYPSKNMIHVATPGWTYRGPTFQVHDPRRGLRYRTVRDVAELRRVLGDS